MQVGATRMQEEDPGHMFVESCKGEDLGRGCNPNPSQAMGLVHGSYQRNRNSL